MTGQPMPCDRCGEPHARCAAHRRDGKPCGQPAMTGQRVCKMHGGKSPGARERAADRQLEAKADAEIGKLWPGLAEAGAVKDPVDLLARTAGALERMAEVVGERVNSLNGRIASGEHLAQLRAEVVLLDRVLDKLLRAGDVMARLGIAERQIELEAEQAQAVISAFLGAVGAVQLLPADRDLVVRRFLEGLGVDRGVLEVEAAGGAA